ncbi:MAG TPA: methyltransferase domain-containing protein, partial [Geminicoccaceae bacterium]
MKTADIWDDGQAYERYVGRWSRRVAAEFLAWLGLPPGLRILDLGCGTGALVETVVERSRPAAVTGLDSAAAFLALVRRRVSDPRVRFEQGDAQALPFEDDAFDAAVSGLVLNFVPRPAEAVAELRRVVRPEGVVALYVWDYAGEMQFMRRFWDAAVALDPGAA